MKKICQLRIELFMREIVDSAKDIENAKNHGPNAAQSSIIKQHTVEVLEHTHTSSHMIKIEISYIVVFNERISTLQK